MRRDWRKKGGVSKNMLGGVEGEGKGKKGGVGMERGKKVFLWIGMELEEVERKRTEGDWFGEIVRESGEIQRKVRQKMINKSQYNR